MDVKPSGSGLLPSVTLGKNLLVPKDNPPLSKEGTGGQNSIDRKRKIVDLKESVSKKMRQSPSIVQGLTFNHGGESSMTAIYSINSNRNNSGPTQPLSNGEPDSEVSERKVKKVSFSSDEDFSPKAKSKLMAPPPEPSKEESQKDKPNEEDDEVVLDDEEEPEDEGDDGEDSSSTEEEGRKDLSMVEPPEIVVGKEEDPNLIKNRLQKRISLYTSDKLIASQIRCDILGLKGGVSHPNRKQVEGSPIFQLRGLKQGDKIISNISGHWISILADYKALGDAPLGQFKPPEGWPPVYSWESFRKYAPNVVKKMWAQRKNRPSLVVLVPSDLAEVPASFFLENLHKLESIRRKFVYYVETSTGSNKRKQYCFCPYCRVLSMNEDAGFSHMRKHLGVEFLCGGCLEFKEVFPKNMSFHMEVCKPCIKARVAKGMDSTPASNKKGGMKGGSKGKKKKRKEKGQ